jgi:single-strand DNA-binding protein
MSLNKVMVIGHLGQDPEIRYTPAGLPVVNFSVATDEQYVDNDGKRHERTEWHRVVIIGKLALTCNEYLKKGRQVFVEGRLHHREYESKPDGRKQRRTEIVASRVQFLGAPPIDLKANEPAVEADLAPESDVPF